MVRGVVLYYKIPVDSQLFCTKVKERRSEKEDYG